MNETAWEPEIYIIENYRGKGYGTEALERAIAGLLSGLLVIDKEGNKEKVITECVRSTVRAENIVSQKMMEVLEEFSGIKMTWIELKQFGFRQSGII